MVDILASSYIHLSSRTPGSVAHQAELHKHNLLGKIMMDNSGEQRSLNYLLKRVSIDLALHNLLNVHNNVSTEIITFVWLAVLEEDIQ